MGEGKHWRSVKLLNACAEVLANGDNILANSVRERRSKNLLIRCKLEASAYSTVGIACGLLKQLRNCNGITKNVKFIVTTTVCRD